MNKPTYVNTISDIENCLRYVNYTISARTKIMWRGWGYKKLTMHETFKLELYTNHSMYSLMGDKIQRIKGYK